MIKRFIPTFYANNVFEITPDFYLKNNFKTILLDLDNTLDSYKTELPSKRASEYINILKKNNIRVIITSNNFGKRVKKYCSSLNIECLSFIKKPFAYKIIKKLKELKIDKKDCLIIGDQLLTDILCGNRAKIATLLTEKIVHEDQFTTRINRLFDKPLRARLKKYDKLNSWKKFL